MKSWLNKNLNLFSLFSKSKANQLTLVNMQGLTKVGDNLRLEQGGKFYDFYDHDFEEKHLQPYLYSTVSTFAIYGVGLGRSFSFLRDWLERDPERALVYFEDDLRMLKYLFETQAGYEILSHPRVFIVTFEMKESELTFDQTDILALFANRRFHLIPSALYEKIYHQKFDKLLMEVLDNVHYLIQQHQYQKEKIFENIYLKLAKLPLSHDGEKLERAFSQIPAILCGAGPSLDKDISALKQTRGKALIFGAGTGMNVLNQRGIHVDFGAGLDPTEVQDSRIRMNHAFMTPYFYTDNFSYESFEILHGPKIYLHKKPKRSIDKWLHQKILQWTTKAFNTGYSTSNLCFVIALYLGCPVCVFSGMDLSYKGGKKYADGVQSHPTDLKNTQEAVFSLHHDRVYATGYEGQKVDTSLTYLSESAFVREYRDKYRQVLCFNSSSEGLGFPGVERLPIEKALPMYYKDSTDVTNLVHAVIAWCPLVPVTYEEIRGALIELKEELKKVKSHLHEHIVELPGYQWCLQDLDTVFLAKEPLTTLQYKYHPEHVQKESFLKMRYSHLLESTEMHIRLIDKTLALLKVKATPIASDCDSKDCAFCPIPTAVSRFNTQNKKEYLEGEILHYQEEGLSTFVLKNGVVVAQSVFKEGLRAGKTLLFYASGAKYADLYYSQGNLDKTQTYYYENGSLKAVLEYNQEKIERVQLYYPSGKNKRIIEFQNGLRHGLDVFYNEEGMLVSEAFFNQDKPFGVARNWYSNGQLKRKVIYDEKTLESDVYEWDEGGRLVKEELFKRVEMEESRLAESVLESIRKLSENLDG